MASKPIVPIIPITPILPVQVQHAYVLAAPVADNFGNVVISGTVDGVAYSATVLATDFPQTSTDDVIQYMIAQLAALAFPPPPPDPLPLPPLVAQVAQTAATVIATGIAQGIAVTQ